MSPLRIRMTPPETVLPQPASLPVDNARHWISPHEEAGNRSPIPVFITQSALSGAEIHAASEPDREVGGVLVGKWCTDEAGQQFVVVSAILPARFTRQGSVYLTFTQDSLVDVHDKLEALFPGEGIVGWYHTHPHMGVFLSHYDTWLHEHFFPGQWQVALVIEPHTAAGGFFIRQADGQLDAGQYFGFYELDGCSGQSVVHWLNLREESEIAQNGGFDRNE